MLFAEIGGAILLACVLFSCLVVPIWITTHDRPTLQPVRRRQVLVRWSAGLCALPLLATIFWDYLGIPPSHPAFVVYPLFFAALVTPLVLLFVKAHLSAGRPARVILTFIAYVLIVVIEVIVPPLATLLDIDRQPISHAAQSLKPGSCGDDAVKPLFAHISDLHISDKERTRDNRYPGNSKLADILKSINAHRPPFLVISGDITDEGTASQWRLLEKLMTPLDPAIRVFASTGNHDLNYFFGSDPEERPWTWFGLFPLTGLDEEPRIFRAAEFQARHLPDLQTSLGNPLREVITRVPTESSLRSDPTSFQAQIDECAIDCVSRSGPSPEDVKLGIAGCRSSCAHDLDSIRFHYYHDLAELFPLTYLDVNSHTAFISLTTSLGDSTSVGRNAIGWAGGDQLKKLREGIRSLPGDVRYIVLVMHHPLLWTGVPPLPRFEAGLLFHPLRAWDAFYSSAWFLAVFLHNDINEGRQIYELLNDELATRPQSSALVLYGHRHERSLGRIGRITLEEAPNLATTDPANYGFYLVGTQGDALNVSWCPVGGK